MKIIVNTVVVSAVLVLTGCGTFGADKKLAVNAAVQTAALSSELEMFRKKQALVAQARLGSIERTESLRNGFLSRAGLNDKLLFTAGETGHNSSRNKISTLLDAIKKQNEQSQIQSLELQGSLKSVVSEVSVPTEQLLKVQKGLTQLGREVSQTDTLKYLAKFINDIKTETEKLQKNAEAEISEADENQPIPDNDDI